MDHPTKICHPERSCSRFCEQRSRKDLRLPLSLSVLPHPTKICHPERSCSRFCEQRSRRTCGCCCCCLFFEPSPATKARVRM